MGYSTNKNSSFQYNDMSTMNDNFDALKYFFTFYPEYKKANFWIAGESYAGKYIPDLAFRIDHFNLDPSTPAEAKINLKGLFIGNGVIDFRNDELEKSTVEYMINRDFIDPEVMQYWHNSCQVDEESAGCQYFFSKFEENTDDINPYSKALLTQTSTVTATTTDPARRMVKSSSSPRRPSSSTSPARKEGKQELQGDSMEPLAPTLMASTLTSTPTSPSSMERRA